MMESSQPSVTSLRIQDGYGTEPPVQTLHVRW